jgi:hypothetical protein
MLGELPSYWCHYQRLCDDGLLSGPLGLPRYLQQVWRLPSLGKLPRAALDRVRARVRGMLRGHARVRSAR